VNVIFEATLSDYCCSTVDGFSWNEGTGPSSGLVVRVESSWNCR